MSKPKCFCGCGMEIGRWPPGRRSVNEAGWNVMTRLAWARYVMGDRADEFTDWLTAGEQHAEEIRLSVHGGIEVADVDEVQRWLAYGREFERRAVEAGAPPIRLWLKAVEAVEYAEREAQESLEPKPEKPERTK